MSGHVARLSRGHGALIGALGRARQDPLLYLGHVVAKNVVTGHGDIQLHAVHGRTLGTTIEDMLKVAIIRATCFIFFIFF